MALLGEGLRCWRGGNHSWRTFEDGRTELWISSRKLDSARIMFRIAADNEFPKSDLMLGFLDKFTSKYGDQPPTLLVAQFHNLECTQKTVIASCLEQQ